VKSSDFTFRLWGDLTLTLVAGGCFWGAITRWVWPESDPFWAQNSDFGWTDFGKFSEVELPENRRKQMEFLSGFGGIRQRELGEICGVARNWIDGKWPKPRATRNRKSGQIENEIHL
jgi:hypothetical protein